MFYNQHLGNVKYIKVIQGQNKYLIEDFKNLSGCYVFATKKKTEALMQEISSDHYSFESFENNNYIKFEDGFPINDYYSFKIIKPEQIISIPYSFNTISSITPDALNSNFEALKETLKKIQESYNNQIVKIDSDEATVMLPNLDDDEVWVRKGDTYRGFNIGSLEANIKEMLDEIKRIREEILREMEDNKNRHLAEIKGKFDQEVAEGKANVIATGEQQVQLVTQTGDTKIEELNSTFTEKNNILINTGDTKNQLLIDTFNSKNQELINTGEQKKSEIIQVASEQIQPIIQEGNKQVQRVTTQGDIEVQRVIDAGVTGKVNRTGDTMTGTLNINNPSAVVSINNVENGFTFLESSSQTGVNVYLGGIGTRWFNDSVSQGVWRGEGEDVKYWGLSKNGVRQLSFDFSRQELECQNLVLNNTAWINASAGNPLTLNSTNPSIRFNETDTGKQWWLVADGSGFRIQPDNTGSTSVINFDNASGSTFMGYPLSMNTNGGIAIGPNGYNVTAEIRNPSSAGSGIEVGSANRVAGMGAHDNGHTYFWQGNYNDPSSKDYTISMNSDYINAEGGRGFYAWRGALDGSFYGSLAGDRAGYRSRTHGALTNRYSSHVSFEDQPTDIGFNIKGELGLLRYDSDPANWGDIWLSSIVNRDTGTIRTWKFNMNSGDFISHGNVVAYSDIKLKKELEIIPNAIEKIQAINGYTFTRKDTGERQTGVIAQEIQKVLPEAVTETMDNKENVVLSVAYGNLVGLLIEGIKDLKKEIEELKTQINKEKKVVL